MCTNKGGKEYARIYANDTPAYRVSCTWITYCNSFFALLGNPCITSKLNNSATAIQAGLNSLQNFKDDEEVSDGKIYYSHQYVPRGL